MENVARVVVALGAPDVVEEVMHFLDRSGRARVIATAGDDRQLAEAVRQLEPDAVVAEPAMLGERTRVNVVLAVDTRESIASLRTAIHAGASGYFLWPHERNEMLRAAESALRRRRDEADRGSVVAVHGARGGIGVTFVASHLAAAFARTGRTILIDADPVYGDVGPALDAPPQDGREQAHTFADVVALGEDLGPEQLGEALWRHDSGVEFLLPPEPEQALRIGPEDLRLVVEAAAVAAETVVLHLPRALDPMTITGAVLSATVLEIVTLDVPSFRNTSRAIEAIRHGAQDVRIDLVVNKASRSEVTPGDVGRVFDRPALAVLPLDRMVRSASERRRLLPARSRMARRFDRLAATMLEEAAELAAS